MKRPFRVLLGTFVVILLVIAYAIYWRGVGIRVGKHKMTKVKEEIVQLIKQSSADKARELLSHLPQAEKMEALLSLLDENDCAVKLFSVQELLPFQNESKIMTALEVARDVNDSCKDAVKDLLESAKGAKH